MKNVFLTGGLQIGKSHAIKRYLESFTGTLGGFTSHRITDEYNIKIIIMKDVNAHSISNNHPIALQNEMGRWEPIIETFNVFGARVLKKALFDNVDLIIMDELGFLEEKAYIFHKAVYECLQSNISVLGVIRDKETAFLNSIRSREDAEIITVNNNNRDKIPNKIKKILG